MTKKENTPAIRFKGFNDTWEQRKLGSVSEKVTKKNQDMVCDEVFTNSAEYGIISQRDFFDKDIANSENIDGKRNMGIGLTVCQSIILAHGGTVRAYNRKEGGAAFEFSLPIKEG